MIKFGDGELLDLLPAQMKHDADMICLSHALKCAVDRLLEFEIGTMADNFIDRLPEKALDMLAVELRVFYYDQGIDLEIRRELVKNALKWHMRAGTVSATEELVEKTLGSGIIREWFEFEGKPYTFKIVTDIPMTADSFGYLNRTIRNVKNARSHLEGIEVNRKEGLRLQEAERAIKTVYGPAASLREYMRKAELQMKPGALIKEKIRERTEMRETWFKYRKTRQKLNRQARVMQTEYKCAFLKN